MLGVCIEFARSLFEFIINIPTSGHFIIRVPGLIIWEAHLKECHLLTCITQFLSGVHVHKSIHWYYRAPLSRLQVLHNHFGYEEAWSLYSGSTVLFHIWPTISGLFTRYSSISSMLGLNSGSAHMSVQYILGKLPIGAIMIDFNWTKFVWRVLIIFYEWL